jgi:pilus assembly protein Flp/PilA
LRTAEHLCDDRVRVTWPEQATVQSLEMTVSSLFQTLCTLSYLTADRAADRVADRLKTLKEEETGASAVEYALLVGLIAVALIGVIIALRGRIEQMFNRVAF